MEPNSWNDYLMRNTHLVDELSTYVSNTMDKTELEAENIKLKYTLREILSKVGTTHPDLLIKYSEFV